jgi:hypothetical protein
MAAWMRSSTAFRVALPACLISLWLVYFLPGYGPAIPNKITPEEYDLYSQWTTQHFPEKAPEHIYFAPRTKIFDPLTDSCKDALHREGVSWSLMKALNALGNAQYPLEFDKNNTKIPWEFTEAYSFPDIGRGKELHYIGFSRVAFNGSHTEALFEVGDSCGGLCGHGGARHARKENGKWTFRVVGCQWIS